MKKIMLTAVFFIGLSLVTSSMSFAVDTKTFTLSANIPAATGTAINAFSVNAQGTPIFTAVTGLDLSFNPMIFVTTNGINIWLPNHFFVVDLAPVGGAGSANATFTYMEGANPNTPGHGLGWKSTATFIKVTGANGSQTETGIATHGPKKLLKDLNGETILTTDFTGGFLRIYIGVVTKDPAATFQDPPTAEVFSNADHSGNYDGQLLISATIP